MGAEGAVQILHRRADATSQAQLASEYRTEYLNPYRAAERGFVDDVIDPTDTRRAVAAALRLLDGKRERLARRKHGNGPL
jgi:acetyl-CoA carboxylase carboxyltransferase component